MKTDTGRLTARLLALTWLAALPLVSQVVLMPRTGPVNSSARAHSNIRVDSSLVLVPVSVCDQRDRPITGLDKENFRVFEDKIEQRLTTFAMDDEPLAVGLVFDISGSMGSKLRKSRLAAKAFFDTANPDDEFFLVEFNDSPRLVVPLTHDTSEIESQLANTQAKGRTALIDAVYLAMNEMKKTRKQRKALLIISDGGDNASRYTATEVKNLVRENDVLIYSIGIYESASLRYRTVEESSGPDLLGQIAGQTGGRHFPVDSLNELPDMAGKIGVELRNRYVLGYVPTQTVRDGKYHKLQIKLVPPSGMPRLRAFWRLGYYAPPD